MKSNFVLITQAVLLFSFTTCKKTDSSQLNNSNNLSDLTTKINATVSGFVTNENDETLEGAVVAFGSVSSTTNKFGYFEIKNASVIKNAAVVTVSKPGYFKGIKTFLASAGQPSFTRIKLIPKIIAGNVNASSGGSVTLSNGLKVELPSNSVVNSSTGASYTGTINVYSSWIDPTSEELHKIMPGNLIGLDSSGELKTLITYGMAAVELTGSSGELLQIASGKKASLTLPIPAVMQSNAPSSIPLWYLDEVTGLWKQAGRAIKTGDNYVGEVSHFSYWDWATWGWVNGYAPVTFELTVGVENSPPNSFQVNISEVGNSVNNRSFYTNILGYLRAGIPAETQFIWK